MAYFDGAKRIRKNFSDLDKARAEAKLAAAKLAAGEAGVLRLTDADRAAYLQSIDLLRPLGAPALNLAVADYVSAVRLLPPNVRLADAVSSFAKTHPSNMPQKTVAEVVSEFIADRELAGCSPIHLRDLGVRLGQFSRAFSVPLASVSAVLVNQYVGALRREADGKPASARTKENMLRCVVSLFNFARRSKYIPAELALDIADIPTPRKQPSPVQIYTPTQMESVLAAADAEIVPALAIAAFAGLRLAEVSRLDWKEVRLPESLIVVEAGKSKTAARRLVPIVDNLAAWLRPYAKQFGPVSPCQEAEGNVGNALGDRFERAARRATIGWKRNGLRHSYISYRVAVLKDVAEVALECGNSPAVIFSNYRALATENEGKAWFGIMPRERPENLIPMPAAAIA